ncbi:hypothetical protein GRX03_10180 [Halovenus sp. WSH3]|uniref:Uncharacterized protein n=1 Tax=Halovenus carboxidivorans TaxID=2692199 RepID=A0A6B0T1Y9_9EURY|nr:hypothetical protein [Halovenus carboxidivorans]MXR51965.1 hypothetical protein [Halovenus carboxidivorans]
MTRDRAINTVVDVALALSFLGIAVLVLSTVTFPEQPEPQQFDADRTAAVLATSTFNVSYSVEPVLEEARAAEELDEDLRSQRISHGTVAAHVAAAAVANLTIRSERVTATGRQYRDAVDNQLRNHLAGTQFETSVAAHWEPYPEAVVGGTATVGADPPPDRDIRTSELTVSSGFDPVRAEALEAVDDGGGYGAVADLIARATIEGYLPAVESKHALEADRSSSVLTRYRYERLSELLEDSTTEAIRDEIEQADAEPADANEQLAAALAAEMKPELRQRFETPRAAARSLTVGTVTITVRTWEP